VLTGSVSGALPVIGGVAVLVADRVLVTLQTSEPRQNGIYDVTQLGNGSTPWILTRSEDSDGTPTSEMKGGNVVTVNEPVPSMRVLTGTGSFLMTDPVLGNNDAILWTAYGSATIPLDLYTDTLTLGGGGVDGSVHVARGSDDVATITLEADTGHITATGVYSWNIGAMVTASDTNAAGVAANAASIAVHTTDIAGHTTTLASHTTSHASHTTTLASHATLHASHTTALATLTADTLYVDNVADADKPVSTAGAAANAALLATGNAHVGDVGNPHIVTATQVGLGACDDTADLDMPVSTAQQAAIDVAAVFRHSVVFKTGAALEQSPSYSPAAGTLTATVNGAPSVGHAMAVSDQVLVAVQGDSRGWVLCRACADDGHSRPEASTPP
jgi:hypothetical protein